MAVSTAVWLGWLALFGVLELSALTHRVPWLTMSRWTWALEKAWWPFPWILLVALALLLVHLVAGKY